MDRLTEHVDEKYICIKGTRSLFTNEERKGAPASNAIVRLAAYEDTGMTPSEIEAANTTYGKCARLAGQLKKCGYDADHVSMLLEAGANERLLVLPYMVGDIFYAICYSEPRVTSVRLYQIVFHYQEGYTLWLENVDKPTDWWKVSMEDFKKWCHFPTYEAAEAALKSQTP